MVRSRLQKQVLSLYRTFLRASQDKPGFTDHIKYEFRKNAVIPKTDGLRIEYLLRRAQNQLKQLEKMECKSMGFFTQQGKNQRWNKRTEVPQAHQGPAEGAQSKHLRKSSKDLWNLKFETK